MRIGYRSYASPYRALAWSFGRGREKWKANCRALRVTLNRCQVRGRDVERSREMWRHKYLEESQRSAELQARVVELEARLAELRQPPPAVPPSTPDSESRECAGPGKEACPKGGQYSVRFMELWTRLVTVANVPLAGVAGVLQVVGEYLGHRLPCPDAGTGRFWLLRQGWAQLTQPLEQASDWIWIVDHTVQIGPQKVFVIVGLRASDLPPAGQALRQTDLHLIALVPQVTANQQTISEELERAIQRTGIPRAILSDHGADLAGGIRRFQQSHPETLDFYDITHKLACLLKPRFEADDRWSAFVSAMGRCKNCVAQTDLAGLQPARLRPKARFMNLGAVIQWGHKIHDLVQRCRSGTAPSRVNAEKVLAKFGWIAEFASALTEWSEWLQVQDASLRLVRGAGYSETTRARLQTELATLNTACASSQVLQTAIEEFVGGQCQNVSGQRFPASSEILESAFGKWKQLERQQSQGGFTGLILGLGALLARTCTRGLRRAWERAKCRNVTDWIQSHLPATVTSQRRALLGTT